MSQAGNNIVIRLEVQIPVSGQGAGQPVVLAAPTSAPPARALANGATQIATPTPGPTKVRVGEGGNFICARGVSLDGNNLPARTVFAKVYAGDVALASIPDLPDGVTRAGTVDRGNGTWGFFGADDSEIPGAQCGDCSGSGSGSDGGGSDGSGSDGSGSDGSGGGTGGVTNTLALWIDWGSDPLEKCRVVFQGCCDTGTECDAPMASSPRLARARATPGGGPAPLHWSLDVEGFPTTGPSALFNGSWVLSLRASDGGHGVWDNDGDGDMTPDIAMRGGGGEDWELALRAGATVVRYRRAARDWNPLGANTFELAEGKTGRRKVPHSLVVVPL